MKSAAICACLTLFFLAPITAQDQTDLVPDSLLNWLRIIETEGFNLIYATDDGESFTAISVDDDGDLLIANHSHSVKDKEVQPARGTENWSMRVADLQSGQDLWDAERTKPGADSAQVTYTESAGILTSAITYSYPRGLVYPLKPYAGQQVRYEVFRYVDGVKETKLSHVLTLPERKTRR